MEEDMKYGLGVNADERLQDIVESSVEMERLGLHYIWVADSPSLRYSPVIASAVAERTSKIRIGLGLLSPLIHRPNHIINSLVTLMDLYGERFEVCIGPGDINQLRRVGIDVSTVKSLPNLLIRVREEIDAGLRREGFNVKVWIGAQGRRLLEISRFFDGVLLNYARPKHVEWAVNILNSYGKDGLYVGVYAPSYIYKVRDESLYKLLRVSSATVALGASDSTLKRLGFYERLRGFKRLLAEDSRLEDFLDEIPDDILEEFAICTCRSELKRIISDFKRLGVTHVIFSYPQVLSWENSAVLSGLPA